MKTKKTASNRIRRGLGVSFPPEMLRAIDERMDELGTSVANRSHYIQRLVEMEIRHKLLGGPGLGNYGGPRPFKCPQTRVNNTMLATEPSNGIAGAVAQSVERVNGIHEVGSSILPSSTSSQNGSRNGLVASGSAGSSKPARLFCWSGPRPADTPNRR